MDTIHPIRIKQRKCTYHCQLIDLEGGYSVTQNHLGTRGKKSVAENADFFLFRMHYCSTIAEFPTIYPKMMQIFLFQKYAKKGAIELLQK